MSSAENIKNSVSKSVSFRFWAVMKVKFYRKLKHHEQLRTVLQSCPE